MLGYHPLQCCTVALGLVAGHIVGGLAGIFLGWGIGPTLQPVADPEASSNANKESQISTPPPFAAMSAAPTEPEIVPNNMARINNPVDGIRRLSISAAFLAGLIGVVASTVHDRVGHLPMPKGLGL